MIVGFPTGGTNDIVARLVAQRLADRLGRPFLVENRPGAGGNIGTDLVAKAAPDGYAIVMASNGAMATNRFLYKSMPFDAEKDFTPIVLVGEVPILFAANPQVPANNLKELVELARAQPNRINAGSPGNGTIGHLTLIYLRTLVDAPLQHVPYKGNAPATADVLSGQIQVIVAPVVGFVGHIQSGALKGLAVTTAKRMDGLPSTPTAAEQGIMMEASSLIGLYGPASLPPRIVDRLNQETNLYIQSPEGRAKLAEAGVQVIGGSPERLASVMADDVQKWKRVVDASGANLKLD